MKYEAIHQAPFLQRDFCGNHGNIDSLFLITVVRVHHILHITKQNT